MTETPRTDAARLTYINWKTGGMPVNPEQPDGWDFARQLERELTALRAELERVTAERDHHKGMRNLGWSLQECPGCGLVAAGAMSKEGKAAAAELEAARKDAERYQWLRCRPEMFHPAFGAHSLVHWKEPEQIDAAIDAAMKEG